MILNFKSIEAFMELAKSQNTKVILTDGGMPMMINPTEDLQMQLPQSKDTKGEE